MNDPTAPPATPSATTFSIRARRNFTPEEVMSSWLLISSKPFSRSAPEIQRYWSSMARTLEVELHTTDPVAVWIETLRRTACDWGFLGDADREDLRYYEGMMEDFGRCDAALIYHREDHDTVVLGEFWKKQYESAILNVHKVSPATAELAIYLQAVDAQIWHCQLFMMAAAHNYTPILDLVQTAKDHAVAPSFAEYYEDWYAERPFWS